MIDKDVMQELEDLINGSIDPSLFPYKKGNSIRIGAYVVRSNKKGIFKVYHIEDSKLIAETFCKTSAVALAKSLASGKSATKSILDLDHELQKWYNDCVFYKHTLQKTKDSLKHDVVKTRYDIARHKTKDARRKLDRFIYS